MLELARLYVGGYGTAFYNAGVGGYRQARAQRAETQPWERIIPPSDTNFDIGVLGGAMLTFLTIVIIPEIMHLKKIRRKRKRLSSSKTDEFKLHFADKDNKAF